MSEQHRNLTEFDSGNLSETASVKIWMHLSLSHIYAAEHLARLSKQAEDSYTGIYDGELFGRHRSYVLGSVLLTVATLEATINEFFLAVIDDTWGQMSAYKDIFKPEVKDSIKKSWQSLERRPTLEKYQLALQLAERQPFAKNETLYQDVRRLIKFRNALMHYKPDWIDGSKGIYDFESDLKALGFPLNPILPNPNPFFPDQCLSYGCAKWAFESVVKFIQEFCSKMTILPTFRVSSL